MRGQEDRELLRAAAKAAGSEIWTDIDGNLYCGDPERRWDPLNDDGDALRLALNLEMPIHPGRVWKHYPANCYGGFAEASRDVTPISDPESTRRAITEVAAEVGRYGK